MLRCGS